MEIYLVRHGQTGGNEAKRHQHETSVLTPLGQWQAELVAARLATFNPTHILVSDRVRAIETGVRIAAATDLVPETTSLVSELHRPANVYGHKHRSARSIRFLVLWFLGRVGEADVDSPAGESYASLRARIKATQAYLATLPPDARVVVVSHAVYIQMFVSHLNRPQPLSLLGALRSFSSLLHLQNTAITTVEYTTQTGWKLRKWNDYTHLKQ